MTDDAGARMGTEPSRLGVSLPNRLAVLGMPAQELVDLAVRAEASGVFGSVWVGDSLIAKPRLESLTLLGALAARTTTVRLGTMCLASFTLRDPILLAIQVASLDQLSEGRLVLGVCLGPGGRGGPAAREELARFWIESGERPQILEANVARLRRLWGQAEPGDTTAEAPVLPRPRQAHLPILVAATPPRGNDARTTVMLERVARLGDGWIADALTPAEVARLKPRLLDAAAAIGRADRMRETVVHVPVVVAPRVEAATALALDFLAAHLGLARDAVTLPSAGAFGPADLVAERLEELRAAGVDVPVIRIMSPKPAEQLERLVDRVVPMLGRASA